ncbi:hypothetical protein NYP20_12025 [Pseudomonas sp. N3-W]|uniref:Uncharacterized protein n=1 Tax=Pseudomonas fungipugnans TaxID=3024217 RepID=A0ABT6QX29_9PSED|nr:MULTISPECIES: hypothetical protein [unclassified Pseudomonas]MDI2595363.1 hypothetical protein [Pseudomonas sp. 681]UWF51645.1 hypothetical protein NYP20_12025 [Pseudomonas sp. N3-W]
MARQVRAFLCPKKNHLSQALPKPVICLPEYLPICIDRRPSDGKFTTSQRNTGPAAQAAPLFSNTCFTLPDHHRPGFKAAMNRPQRFRGLATDPGVQRKTSKAVIQRENTPKGPWLEAQFEIGQ